MATGFTGQQESPCSPFTKIFGIRRILILSVVCQGLPHLCIKANCFSSVHGIETCVKSRICLTLSVAKDPHGQAGSWKSRCEGDSL